MAATFEQVNFVGHIAVARALHPGDGLVHLGSALPDLATIGRFRLANKPTEAAVRRGVDLHHRTDDAFHGHAAFLAWNKAILTALTESGLNRGASRACAHVGSELLLDGHLLATQPGLRPAAQRALELAASPEAGLDAVVAAEHIDRWDRHRSRVASWPVPEDYHDPAAVARRLQRIVADRPRLSFGTDQVDLVAGVLADHQEKIAADAKALLADLERDVSPPIDR